MPQEDSVQHRALKDWLNVNRSVASAVEGIVQHEASLTTDRVEAILDGMDRLEGQTMKLRAAIQATP